MKRLPLDACPTDVEAAPAAFSSRAVLKVSSLPLRGLVLQYLDRLSSGVLHGDVEFASGDRVDVAGPDLPLASQHALRGTLRQNERKGIACAEVVGIDVPEIRDGHDGTFLNPAAPRQRVDV